MQDELLDHASFVTDDDRTAMIEIDPCAIDPAQIEAVEGRCPWEIE